MLSMQLSKRFVQQIVLDGFAFVGILNNLLDCYKRSCRGKLDKIGAKAKICTYRGQGYALEV